MKHIYIQLAGRQPLTKVTQHSMVVAVIEEYVMGVDVTMTDLVAVHVGKGAGNTTADGDDST